MGHFAPPLAWTQSPASSFLLAMYGSAAFQCGRRVGNTASRRQRHPKTLPKWCAFMPLTGDIALHKTYPTYAPELSPKHRKCHGQETTEAENPRRPRTERLPLAHRRSEGASFSFLRRAEAFRAPVL